MEASWDKNWKDKVKIAKAEAKLGERRQDRSKRSEEEARMRQRNGKLSFVNCFFGSRWRWLGSVALEFGQD